MGKRSYFLDDTLLLSSRVLVDALSWSVLYPGKLLDSSGSMGETMYHHVAHSDGCRLDNLVLVLHPWVSYFTFKAFSILSFTYALSWVRWVEVSSSSALSVQLFIHSFYYILEHLMYLYDVDTGV